MISVDVGKINLKHILESGQCFRWTQKTDNIFNFVKREIQLWQKSV